MQRERREEEEKRAATSDYDLSERKRNLLYKKDINISNEREKFEQIKF